MLRISMVTEHHPGELRIIQGKNSPISLFHCTQQRKQQLDYSSYVTVMSCRWNVNAQRTSLTFLKVFSVSPTSNRGVVYPRGKAGGTCPWPLSGGGAFVLPSWPSGCASSRYTVLVCTTVLSSVSPHFYQLQRISCLVLMTGNLLT